jgi:outer membrane lipoprotein-sorting protein
LNPLRRLALSRLLLLCALVVALGVSATAIASAVGAGPTAPAKPLADAVHGALTAPPVEGFSASVRLTDHLLEGASLAGEHGGTGLSSSPLLSGASGRVWISKDGKVRLELQQEKGDTEIYYDGRTVSMYDTSANTLYRYTPSSEDGWTSYAPLNKTQAAPDTSSTDQHEPPSVAKIEEAITRLKQHVNVSGATPSDVAEQPTYTVRVSPNEGGSLIGGAELSWDANHGIPLRAAVYSTTSSSPVIELTATGEVSYAPVASSVFEFTPPPGVKIQEVKLPEKSASTSSAPADSTSHPKITQHGHGIGSAVVAESTQTSTSKTSTLPEGLPRVKINGTTATELPTALGTLLSFERSGVRYLVGGFVTPSTVEAVARGL